MMDLIRKAIYKGFKVELFDQYGNDGRDYLHYRLYHYNDIIFEGKDFGPSPIYPIDSNRTVAAILDFLSLVPGDTDKEYFKDYTQKQMSFAEKNNDELEDWIDILEAGREFEFETLNPDNDGNAVNMVAMKKIKSIDKKYLENIAALVDIDSGVFIKRFEEFRDEVAGEENDKCIVYFSLMENEAWELLIEHEPNYLAGPLAGYNENVFIFEAYGNGEDAIDNELYGYDAEDCARWAGYDDTGFNDEYDSCSDCQNVIKTSPNCYGWKADYVYVDSDILCCDCIKDNADDLIGGYVNNPNKPVPDEIRENIDMGFVPVDIWYENGIHPGQNDDPRKMGKLLNDNDIDYFIEHENSQFYVEFRYWVQEEKEELAKEVLDGIW